MADSNPALDILTKQVESLTAQLQKLTSERDEYRDALTEITSERDSLKAKIANPDAQAARIAELEAAIRDRAHFDRFSELAKGAKAKEAAIRHLWQLSGYKAEHDEIDEKALGDVLKRLKAEAGYAFDPEDGNGESAVGSRLPTPDSPPGGVPRGVPSAARGAAPGGGRGARNQGGDGTIITAEMRADPRFMLDPRNREIIAAAAREGRFR